VEKLNCSIGDLAITVKANLPANLGNIVRIIGSQGLQEWEGQDEPLYTWDVEIVGEERYLHYHCDGEMVKVKEGPAPDQYLRRLTPPQGYQLDEIFDSEPVQKPHFLSEEWLELGK
jgi:hypothetical protein